MYLNDRNLVQVCLPCCRVCVHVVNLVGVYTEVLEQERDLKGVSPRVLGPR